MSLPKASGGAGTTTLTGTGIKKIEKETEQDECTLFAYGFDPTSTLQTFAMGWGS